MSSEGPNPLAFKSWEDAFQHPIPLVRKLELQLRNHGEDNRHKLRNLVGLSYRELLGTAERIIDMDERMQEVDLTLGLAGQKCNSRAVDRIFHNHAKLQTTTRARNSQRNALAAHLIILQTCPTTITRLLRRGGSSLLVSKILVLARLTHKVLSQESDAAPFIESLRQRLAIIREKTLSAIDKRLASPDDPVQALVQDMCAFSLATSSTPTDVLRHFHAVRLKTIVWHLKQGLDTRKHVVNAVSLLLTTLRDSQLIFPKRLSEALANLKEQPLVRQPDVLSVNELNLDVHERWIADELRNYTPWPRHDELLKPEADKQTKAWAKQALEVFMKGLEAAISEQTDFKHVMNIRKDLLDAWPWSDTRLPGLHSADVVDDFRNILNSRLVEIIQQNAAQLQGLPIAVSAALQACDELPEQEPPLWDHSSTTMELGNGAASFKQAVLARYQGGNAQFSQLLPIFEQWTEGIVSTRSLLREMRDGRWDDDITEDVDDPDSRQVLLSEDDPRTLELALEASLEKSSEELQSALLKIVDAVGQPGDKRPNKVIFLLRLLREISHRSASHERRIATVCQTSTSSTEILAPLHAALVTSAMAPALTRYRESLSKMLCAAVLEARTLWEGHPQAPVQPLAVTFKFLRKVTKNMVTCGADLWASAAIHAAKSMLAEQLNSIMASVVSQIQGEAAQGQKAHGNQQNDGDNAPELDASSDSEVEVGVQVKRDRSAQLLFDVLYLQRALDMNDTSHQSALQQSVDLILSETELGAAEVSRIRQNAAEYWKRTYLLFALLSPGC